MPIATELNRIIAAKAAIRAAIEAKGVSVPIGDTLEDYAAYIAAISSGPATAPSAFTAGMWTLTAGDTQATIGVTSLPANGGSPITALQYRIDGGTAVTMSGTGTGDRIVTGLTNGTEVDFELRAVNAIGNGAWGDLKSVTPVAPSVTYIEFSTLSSMTAGGSAGATRTYTGTAAEGTAGTPSATLAMGSAGGIQVQINNAGTDPMIGLYTSASGAWNAGIQIIMYKSSADWVVNDAAFNVLGSIVGYTVGDNARIRYDTGNTYFAEIERAATPGTWTTIATGTLARSVTLHPRLCSFGGSGVVFTGARVP